MSRWLVRLVFYVMLLLDVLIFFFSFRYVLAVKSAPLAIVEPVYGSAVVNGRKVTGPTELDVGSYRIIGECKIRLFGSRTKVVRLQHFEVEITWEK